MRTLTTALIATLAVACTNSNSSDPSIVPVPPDHGLHPVITLPDGAAALFGGGTSFLISGPTAPGSASVDGAPVVEGDDEEVDVLPGGGAFDITVDGVHYAASSSANSVAFLDDEMSGTEYVEIIAFAQRTEASATFADEVVIIVPASDVTPGATIALDGQDRIALFVSGDISQDQPSLFAAAVTGSVTISAGTGTAGASISASVTGDFGSVDFVEPGDPSNSLTDGNYALAVTGAADVYCDGSLAGKEGSFASITAASLGLTGGNVVVSNSGLAIAGSVISSAFGASPLSLSDSGDGAVVGFSDESAAGPEGTTLVGKFIAFDKATASSTFVNGAVGAGYVVDDGQCSINFEASLTGN